MRTHDRGGRGWWALPGVVAAAVAGCAPGPRDGGRDDRAVTGANQVCDERTIGAVLDRLHDAAARADGPAYWSCFAPEAVFIGTDATERWTLPEFQNYAEARFATGKGWAYTPSNRHVVVRGDVGWFDETVTNEKYGACRGTGVVVRDGRVWRVAQYHLTLPIPNALFPEVAGRVKGYMEGVGR